MVPRWRQVPKARREEILRVLSLAGIPLWATDPMFGPVVRGMWLQNARDILVDAYPDVEVYWRQDCGPSGGSFKPLWALGVRTRRK